LNKEDLVARVARETGLTKADVLRALDGVLAVVARSLRKGERVKLVDFGTFTVTRRRARAGHNAHTGQPMRIAARRWPRFTPGKALKLLLAEPVRPRARRATHVAKTAAAGSAPKPALPPGEPPTPEKPER
jgi:DNA-binding protein HU-beta